MALDLGGLFSAESPIGQMMIYGVLQQVISATLGPGLSVTEQDINSANPVEVISPSILADLVVRNYLDQGAAAAVAAKSGVSADDFALLCASAGDALDTTTLMTAYRRKIIQFSGAGPDDVTVEAGIREGRLSDKWLSVLQALGTVPIGVADAVDAVVENQISFADGQEYAYQNGLDPAAFQILVNTRGNPPDPTTLAEMVNRGIIPMTGTGPDVLSFEQGISEGATKDKWIKSLEAIMSVQLPEGRVTTLLKDGVITQDDAISRYQKLGYDQPTAEAMVAEALTTKTADDKALAKSDVTALYSAGAIDGPTAITFLGALGYDASTAAEVLAIQDFHKATALTNTAISKIQSYFVARKITDTQAVNALNSLNIPSPQQVSLISTWKVSRTSNLKALTEAQITDAWNYGIMEQDVALAELEALGYTPYDSWVILSVKNKGALDGEPPPDAIPSD